MLLPVREDEEDPGAPWVGGVDRELGKRAVRNATIVMALAGAVAGAALGFLMSALAVLAEDWRRRQHIPELPSDIARARRDAYLARRRRQQ